MSSPQDEIEALKSQVASLTARVYDLELRSSAASQPQQQAATAEHPQSRALPPSETILQPPRVASVSQPLPSASAPFPQKPQTPGQSVTVPTSKAAHDDANLEKKIGQYWLNRIGIVAMLIGVS
jgi:uncharacterized membrane protein